LKDLDFIVLDFAYVFYGDIINSKLFIRRNLPDWRRPCRALAQRPTRGLIRRLSRNMNTLFISTLFFFRRPPLQTTISLPLALFHAQLSVNQVFLHGLLGFLNF